MLWYEKGWGGAQYTELDTQRGTGNQMGSGIRVGRAAAALPPLGDGVMTVMQSPTP